MTPLQLIPARLRLKLYWTGYLLGVLGQGTTIVWGAVAAASGSVEMPVYLVVGSAVVGLLQTQLNLLSGANVSLDPPAPPTPPASVAPAAPVVAGQQPAQ